MLPSLANISTQNIKDIEIFFLEKLMIKETCNLTEREYFDL